MSYNTTCEFTAGICVEKLKDLMEIEGDLHSPLLKRSPLGLVEFLNSPINTSGRDIIPIQEADKKKTVRIKYRSRDIESQVLESDDGSCSGDCNDFSETLFDVENIAIRKISLKESEVAKICEGQGDFMLSVMGSAFDALAQNVNKNLILNLISNFGINISNGLSTAKDLTVFPAATGNINARPLQVLKNDYVIANQMKGAPAIIGAGNMYDYWQTLAAGCCNDAGINMLEMQTKMGASFWADTQFDSQMGTNHFAILEPTLTHFVVYNEYVGAREKNDNPFVVNTTLSDPRTGINYDMKMMFDACTDEWFIKLKLNWGVWFQPLDAYQVADPVYGTNGSLRYRAITS